MGYGLYVMGTIINTFNDFRSTFLSVDDDELTSVRLMFAGSFLTCLFWVSIYTLLFELNAQYYVTSTGSGAGNVAMVCHWHGN